MPNFELNIPLGPSNSELVSGDLWSDLRNKNRPLIIKPVVIYVLPSLLGQEIFHQVSRAQRLKMIKEASQRALDRLVCFLKTELNLTEVFDNYLYKDSYKVSWALDAVRIRTSDKNIRELIDRQIGFGKWQVENESKDLNIEFFEYEPKILPPKFNVNKFWDNLNLIFSGAERPVASDDLNRSLFDRINLTKRISDAVDGTGIICAVIDHGFDLQHPDLCNSFLKNTNGSIGANFVFGHEEGNILGGFGQKHGTATAGLISGSGTNGKRTGVAPGAKIIPLVAGGYESSFAHALEYALENKANLVLCTIDFDLTSQINDPVFRQVVFRRMAEKCGLLGVIVIAAVGNHGKETCSPEIYRIPNNVELLGRCPSPSIAKDSGLYSSVVTVGASKLDNGIEKRSDFSSKGPCSWNSSSYYNDFPMPDGLIKPDVSAPGELVPTCKPGGGYVDEEGSSFSAAIVAGALCLLLQNRVSDDQIVEVRTVVAALEEGAKQVDNFQKNNEIGYGVIDIEKSIRALEKREP